MTLNSSTNCRDVNLVWKMELAPSWTTNQFRDIIAWSKPSGKHCSFSSGFPSLWYHTHLGVNQLFNINILFHISLYTCNVPFPGNIIVWIPSVLVSHPCDTTLVWGLTNCSILIYIVLVQNYIYCYCNVRKSFEFKNYMNWDFQRVHNLK
jgi:hypothetical protein